MPDSFSLPPKIKYQKEDKAAKENE